MALPPLFGSRRPLLLVLLVCLLCAGLTPTAHSASAITVTGNLDEVDNNGLCSLREAIQAANTDKAVDACQAGNGVDTIVLRSGEYIIYGPDPRTHEPVIITSDLTLTGAGSTLTIIYGLTLMRTIEIQRGTVAIDKLRISGGSAEQGGAIRNAGILTVAQSSISGSACFGGGIYNDTAGVLTIRDSFIVFGSTLTCDPGYGGGIYNQGIMTLTNTAVSGNQAGTPSYVRCPNCAKSGYGGGIYNQGTMTLTNTAVAGNEAGPRGSPCSGCTASGYGGGILNAGVATLSFVSVINNTAHNGDGGGVFNQSTLHVSNTLIAGNDAARNHKDCFGSLETGGHNLISQLSACRLNGTAPGDIVNRDAHLTPHYGLEVPQPPWALSFGSPAIDAADRAACPATDRVGTPRPVDGNADGTATCDIGAYELPAAHQVFWVPDVARTISRPSAPAAP